MIILGIETSCDETAAAVVKDGREILSNVVVSQIDIFAEYGGVIPEVAARSHLEVMMPVVNKALSDAGCGWDDIDAIAVTHAPGLLGSLLIGTLTARTLAILHDKPLYAVHHLKSHVYANWLSTGDTCAHSRAASLAPIAMGLARSSSPCQAPDSLELSTSCLPTFPLLALVVSGGHTQILYMRGHNQFEIVGTTVDDAVGECFDKVAKILGLPYPGGPSIAAAAIGGVGASGACPSDTLRAALAKSSCSAEHIALTPTPPGDSSKYKFPHPKVEGLNFSFSGLKTAVLREVQKELRLPISHPSHDLKNHLSAQQIADFAASFQKTAVDILIEKLKLALKQYPDTRSIVIAGGVSANEKLRERVLSEPIFSASGLEFSGTSYAGAPAEPSLRDEPVGRGRNIRAENSNQKFTMPSKTGSATRSLFSSERSGRRLSRVKTFPGAKTLEETGSVARSLFFPAPELSGDNGAMVAGAAYWEIQSGVEPVDPYKLNIYPRISIEN